MLCKFLKVRQITKRRTIDTERFNFENIPMEDHEIKDVKNRSRSPVKL